MNIAGISIRTTNQEAANTIPDLWKKFFESGGVSLIKHRLNDNIYALYTDFENEGKNNEGIYTFLIGMQVDPTQPLEAEYTTCHIPEGKYCVFEVEKGKPEKVFETWHVIWGRSDLDKSFVCDFEEYQPDGSISVNVGVRS